MNKLSHALSGRSLTRRIIATNGRFTASVLSASGMSILLLMFLFSGIAFAQQKQTPQNPPVEATCLSGKVDVACGKKPGTFVLTLSTAIPGGITPDYVMITPVTAGVTIVNPQWAYPVINGQVFITVAGANPGDALQFDMTGFVQDAGPVEGSDICCSGRIKVEIPKGLDCKDRLPIDVAIKKVGKTSPEPTANAYSFALALTNEGAAFTPAAGQLVVTDTVPAGMTFNTITGSAGWSCLPATANAGATITCTFAGGPIASGPATPIGSVNITATATGSAPFPPVKNCADIGTIASAPVTDKKLQNNHSCVTVTKPPVVDSKVAIKKTCEIVEKPEPVMHYGVKCVITVTTTGPIQSQLTVLDSLTGNGNVTSFTNTSTPPWTCAANQCQINGSSLNQTSSVSTFEVLVGFSATFQKNQINIKNCGRLGLDNQPAGESCAIIKGDPDTPPSGPGTLSVTKTCDPATEVVGAINHYESICHITVSTTGPQGSQLTVNDNLVGGGTITSVTGLAPWTCSGTSCSVNGGQLNQTASTSVFDVAVSFPSQGHVTEANNCATLVAGLTSVNSCTRFTVGEDKKGKLTVNKIALAGDRRITNQIFDMNLTCGNNAQVIHVTDGAPYVQTGIPVGTDCDLSEIVPAPAADLCPQGQVGSWVATYAPSENVTIPATGATFTVTNTLKCEPAVKDATTFSVRKKVVRDGQPVTGASFPMTVTCGRGDVHAVSVPAGDSVTIGNLPNGTSCNVVENPVSNTGLCPAGTTEQWNTSYVPPSATNTTSTLSSVIVTVRNELICVPGAATAGISVNKVVVNNAPGSIEGLRFPVTTTCVANVGGEPLDNDATHSLTNGETQYYLPYMTGGNCSVHEGAIPATTACGKLQTPKWTTTYSPSQTVAMQPGGQTVTVTNTLDCEPIDVVLPPPLACDRATATNAGDLCRCRFDNMTPVSKTACECKDGFTLKAGQGCVREVVTPKCDPATTVAKGGKCVCEYRNMVQTSATACACSKGLKLVPGKGCVRPEPVCKQGQRYQPARDRCEPVCAKGFDYNQKRNACIQRKPDCRQGTVYNPKNGKCVAVRPDCPEGTTYSAKRNRCVANQPVCRKPFVYDARRNACVEQVIRCERGTIPFRGRCVPVPKCGPGQIPVPGTGLCVSIGGGGGQGPREDNGGAKDQPRCVPTAARACD